MDRYEYGRQTLRARANRKEGRQVPRNRNDTDLVQSSCLYCGGSHGNNECPGGFLYQSAKGKLAEVIVRELFSKAQYVTLPSGFESLFPELSFRIYRGGRSQLSTHPDFVVYKETRNQGSNRPSVSLIEVKFRKEKFKEDYLCKNLAELIASYVWWPPFFLVICYGNGEIEAMEVTRDFFQGVYENQELISDPFGNANRVEAVIAEYLRQTESVRPRPIEQVFPDLDPNANSDLAVVREVARRLLIDGPGYAEERKEPGDRHNQD